MSEVGCYFASLLCFIFVCEQPIVKIGIAVGIFIRSYSDISLVMCHMAMWPLQLKFNFCALVAHFSGQLMANKLKLL
jgi:hypothetical protein